MEKWSKFLRYVPVILGILLICVNNGVAISCYQCMSSEDMTCGDTLAEGHTLEPSDCSHLQEPLFCVKMTGMSEVLGISCYQCDSGKDVFCPETISQLEIDAGYLEDFKPLPCDHVFDAQYCIKTTGLFQGQLGTKRFCSARDFGNYCEMVTRPGDERLYRACYYTCQQNECNYGSVSSPSRLIACAAVLFSFVIYSAFTV